MGGGMFKCTGWVVTVVSLTAAATGALHAQTPSAPAAQGKIIAATGRVQHTAAPAERWDSARLFQPLLVAERVRTLEASRASILFIDESQVKLNAGAVLTIREIKSRGGAGTSLELSRGEGWFRTKNPNSGLTVRTPAAAAAVRGTEINIRVGANDETVLTVVEGSVEFSNPQGSILVNAGEEGTAVPGQAPTKRVILNPEDAVQWALYYPAAVAYADLPAAALTGASAAGYERLRAGDATAALQQFGAQPQDAWARIGASLAHLTAGDTTRAREIIAQPMPSADAELARRAQLAAVALAVGEAATARSEINAVLAQDPGHPRALALLSSLELRRNQPVLARQAAERALAARPDSVGALRAASEAAQAQFDLTAARRFLDRAIAVDPRDVHALVNRARIRFGTDDTSGAREDMDRAAAIAPNDAQVRSLRGFIRLADGDVAEARADFDAAIAADPELGEPHLGLGLAYFRENRTNEGLLEMLTATLLEPKVALYQSYLGKAYYQAGRFPEGLSALASAKRLDPRDPTPWLYGSFYLRDQNRQVEALEELRHAIALNDHRAVYRSRLLLDRDLATKNVSLAELYRQLGFEAWGAFEALNSLETDFTNASAHLFLADTYGGLTDRTQALGSELLQYFLYAPVNRNAFNNFAEYTALLEQPGRQLTIDTQGGSGDRFHGGVTHRGGNERFAHVAFIQTTHEDGTRPTQRDERVQGFVQSKLSLSRKTDVFFSFSGVRDEEGASRDSAGIFGLETGSPVILRQFTPVVSPHITGKFTEAETTLGMKHQWKLGSALTGAVRYTNLERISENTQGTTSACRGFDLTQFGARTNSVLRNPYRTLDAQFQQITRLGRHQLVVGQRLFTQEKDDTCEEVISIEGLDETLPLSSSASGHDSAQITYVRDEFQLSPRVHLTGGLTFSRVKYAQVSSQREIRQQQWDPRVGISVRVGPSTFVRAAAYRHLNAHLFGATIAPPTIAGFVLARNEFETARRTEYNASVEHAIRRAFFGVRAFTRQTEVPYLLADGVSFIPEADAKMHGTSAYVNWIVAPRVTVFGENQFVFMDANTFNRHDNLVRAGVNLIHPGGIFARFSGTFITQRFSDTPVTGLPRSTFFLGDFNLGYEFANKRGQFALTVRNAFDRRFATIVEGVTVTPLLPERRVFAGLRWRVW